VIVAQRLRNGSFRAFDNVGKGRTGDAERRSSPGDADATSCAARFTAQAFFQKCLTAFAEGVILAWSDRIGRGRQTLFNHGDKSVS
jgi:hypothetical protein